MKNTVLAMAALGALALWTSCSNEEFPAPVPGGDGTVTFTATLPANISSRAYGDGEVAKTLHYAVYEAGSDKVVFASDVAESPAAACLITAAASFSKFCPEWLAPVTASTCVPDCPSISCCT